MRATTDDELTFAGGPDDPMSFQSAEKALVLGNSGCWVMHSFGWTVPPAVFSSCGLPEGVSAQPSSVDQVAQLLEWLEELQVCPGHLGAHGLSSCTATMYR